MILVFRGPTVSTCVALVGRFHRRPRFRHFRDSGVRDSTVFRTAGCPPREFRIATVTGWTAYRAATAINAGRLHRAFVRRMIATALSTGIGIKHGNIDISVTELLRVAGRAGQRRFRHAAGRSGANPQTPSDSRAASSWRTIRRRREPFAESPGEARHRFPVAISGDGLTLPKKPANLLVGGHRRGFDKRPRSNYYKGRATRSGPYLDIKRGPSWSMTGWNELLPNPISSTPTARCSSISGPKRLHASRITVAAGGRRFGEIPVPRILPGWVQRLSNRWMQHLNEKDPVVRRGTRIRQPPHHSFEMEGSALASAGRPDGSPRRHDLHDHPDLQRVALDA